MVVNLDFIKVPIKSKCKNIYNKKAEFALNWVKHHRSLNKWVPDLLRPGPTLIDLGGHINRHIWNSQTVKKENTIKFIKKIDKEWNKIYEVEKSTERTFKI